MAGVQNTATLVTALRGVDTLGDETRRTRDVSPALAQLQPDAGPLTTLLSKTRSKACTDPKFEWFEHDLKPRFDVVKTALSTTDGTTFVVTNYKRFRAGDVIMVNKKERMRVTTTPSSTSVTVQRGYGSTAAATAAVGDQIKILYNSCEEGAAKRSLLSAQRVPKYNYCGIIRDPFGITKTAMATKAFAGMDFTTEQATELIEHKKNIEQMHLEGERYEDTTGTKPKRASMGIDGWIETFVKAVNGNLTEAALDSHLRVSFRFGQKVKLGLCSPIAAQAINGFAKENLRVVEKSASYGITLSRYENAGRVLLLAEHSLMTNDDLNDFSGIAGEMLIIDLEDVEQRYLNGRLTIHNENIQAPDEDQRTDEYLSEVGLEVHLEKKHGKLTGITG